MSAPREERMVEAGDGARICAESFGDPADPPVLLLMGQMASMLWWPEELCEQLRPLRACSSSATTTGHRALDELRAGQPGLRVGGPGGRRARRPRWLRGRTAPTSSVCRWAVRCTQAIALHHPDRVLTATLMSTTRVDEHDVDLPGPSSAYMEQMGAAEGVDPADRDALARLPDRGVPPARRRAPVRRDVDARVPRRDYDRTASPASLGNHELLTARARSCRLASIAAPVLVVHGTADPMFPRATARRSRRRSPELGSCRSRAADTACRSRTGTSSWLPIVAHVTRSG